MSSYTFSSRPSISAKNAEIDKKYKEWFSCLPDNHIQSFVIYGLKPFLKKFGYTLGFSEDKMVSYIKRWAFNYVFKNNKEFVMWAHDGGEEEYDWYRFTISMDDWEELCVCWKAPGFLDDSDAGFYQATYLSLFIWQCISLELSKQHTKWLEINTEYEEEEQWVYDDNHAYGGDRRTY